MYKLLVIVLGTTVNGLVNNVCRTGKDYATIQLNTNCWYNPDVNSTMEDIAARYGYPLENHKVTTQDGYILTLYRIPRNNTDPNSKRQPVIIQHGIGGTAIFWVLQGHGSLAFFLVNNGYDVWLPTLRGGTYSVEHEKLSTMDPRFWEYGVEELAEFDLISIIEHVAGITHQKGNIIYVGHSMGTTISYIYATEKKQHANEYLKGIVSLAPVAYMQNVRGLYHLAAPFAGLLTVYLHSAGLYGSGQFPILNSVIFELCSVYPILRICEKVSILTSGYSREQYGAETIPLFFSYFPVGITTKTLNYFSQLILSGRFQKYDYGSSRNLLLYKTETPLEYNVSKISLPVHLLYGRSDFIGNEKDVNTLYLKLNPNRTWKYHFNFAHNDFFLGRKVKEFHNTLARIFRKIGNGSK